MADLEEHPQHRGGMEPLRHLAFMHKRLAEKVQWYHSQQLALGYRINSVLGSAVSPLTGISLTQMAETEQHR